MQLVFYLVLPYYQNLPALIALRTLPLLLLLLFFSACARPFLKPELTTAPYAPAGSTENLLDFDLSREPLPFAQPHAGKLQKRNVYVYAVRIGNPSPDTVWFVPEQLQLRAGERLMPPLPARQFERALRQPVALHGLWFLAGPFLREGEGGRVLDYHPLGVAFAAWGIRNIYVAHTANQDLKEMIAQTMPRQQTPIAPAGILYVLIPLESSMPPQELQLYYLSEPAAGTQ
jgi:hypothetical protein